MDEHQDSESRVRSSGHVVVVDETPIGDMDFDDAQVEDGAPVDEVDGACNEDDVMVEVLGSDVFVDGVCSSVSGGNSEEDDELEVGHNGSVAGVSVSEVNVGDGVNETMSNGSFVVDQTQGDQEEEGVAVVGEVAVLLNDSSADGGLSRNESLKHIESLDGKITREAGSVDDETRKSESDSGIVSSTIIVVEPFSVEPPVQLELNQNEEVRMDASKDVISSGLEDLVSTVANDTEKTHNDIAACEGTESSCELTQINGNKVSEVHKNDIVDSRCKVLGDDYVNVSPVCSDSNQCFQAKIASEKTINIIAHEGSEISHEVKVRGEVVAVDIKVALNVAQVPKAYDIEGLIDDHEISPLDDTRNADFKVDNTKVFCANLESFGEQKGELVTGDATIIGQALSDSPNKYALDGSFKENTNAKADIECEGSSKNGIDEADDDVSHLALNSTSTHDGGLDDQCQGLVNDGSVVNIDQTEEHHASELVVFHEEDNQVVETKDQSCEVPGLHHEAVEVQGLVDTFGFPAPECLGDDTPCDVTELGSDAGLDTVQNIEADEDGTDIKPPKTTGEKRKAADSFDDECLVQERKKSMFNANLSNTASLNPRQSYKIGDCISRVASQLTGSPLVRKINVDIFQKVDLSNHRSTGSGYDASFQTIENSMKRKMTDPSDDSTPDKMLPHLHLLAQDPVKEYTFRNTIVSFFSDFRNSVVPGQYSMRGSITVDKVGNCRKRKPSHSLIGSPKTFEFEDMKDSYWTDRVIQNGSDEQPSRKNKREYHLGASQPENLLQASPCLYPRKKSENGSGHKSAGGRSMSSVDARKPDLSPTEIVMKFPQGESVPTETNLNKMFRRFAPLKESETEVDRGTNRARVIFKRRSDAEVAFSSAGKFNIFGHILVTYELNYSPSVPFKAPTIIASQDLEAAIAQDMEMAATEYLEDATTQYLDDVSIQYLEDGTTQYMEDVSMHYLEDGSIQYLEVAMAQHPENGNFQTVEALSSNNLGVDTTEYIEDTTAHNLKGSPSQNLEVVEIEKNIGVEIEQNLEDVTAQNLKSPNLESVEMQNLGAASPQNLEYETTENLEFVEVHDRNEQDATTVHSMDDVMARNVEEAAQAVGDMEGDEVQNVDVGDMEGDEVQNVDVGDMDSDEVQNVDVSVPQHLEAAMTRDLDTSATEQMKNEKPLHSVDDVMTYDVVDAAAQTMDDVEGAEVQTMDDVEGAEVQTMDDVEGAEVQTMDVSVPQQLEAAMANDLDDLTREQMQNQKSVHSMDNVTTQGVEGAAQAVDDEEGAQVQNVGGVTPQHLDSEAIQNREAATAHDPNDLTREVHYMDSEGVMTQCIEEAAQAIDGEVAEHHMLDVKSHEVADVLECAEMQSVEVEATEQLHAVRTEIVDDARCS